MFSAGTVIPSLRQVMIQVHSDAEISLTTGTVEGSPAFMRKTCLIVSAALVDLDDGKTVIQVTNPNNHTFTQSQYHTGTLPHSHTTSSGKHHAPASGTLELDHQAPRRGGSSD